MDDTTEFERDKRRWAEEMSHDQDLQARARALLTRHPIDLGDADARLLHFGARTIGPEDPTNLIADTS